MSHIESELEKKRLNFSSATNYPVELIISLSNNHHLERLDVAGKKLIFWDFPLYIFPPEAESFFPQMKHKDHNVRVSLYGQITGFLESIGILFLVYSNRVMLCLV